jgi:hypothetical protein
MHYDHVANTLSTMKSTTTLHSQIHEIAHSNYIGFMLLASMYNTKTGEEPAMPAIMKHQRKIDVKARGFHVNT